MTADRTRKQAFFRTVVPVPKNPKTLSHTDTVITLGSCFSENIAQRLTDAHFNVCSNPTGILFNPASIAQTLKNIRSHKRYTKKDLICHEELWKSFDHHSQFQAPTWQQALRAINVRMKEAEHALSQVTTIIMTFGTAYAYYLKENNRLVANCHRFPHTMFSRVLLSIDSIIEEYTALLHEIYRTAPDLNVIITVSPVRHLRDNPFENSVSKAHLLAAIHELLIRFPHVYYFPAYEIMMDELRDYRFYADDMAHPSPVAVTYIWEQFAGACLDKQSLEFISMYEPVLAVKKHRKMHGTNKALQHLARKHCDILENLEKRFPDVSLREDREYFQSLI